jgi:predicted amidophosphoribosyltransferase
MLAQALIRRGLAAAAGSSVIVPVPLGRSRLRGRGYDQSLLLARHLGRELRRNGQGPAKVVRALRRIREGPSQASLGRAERIRNPRGAFEAASRRDLIAGASVVLVDDVLTTGATAVACIEVLRRIGSAGVIVAVAGRTPALRTRKLSGSTGGEVEID